MATIVNQLALLLADYRAGPTSPAKEVEVSSEDEELVVRLQSKANPKKHVVGELLRLFVELRGLAEVPAFSLAKATLIALDEAVSWLVPERYELPAQTVIFSRRWWMPDGGSQKFSGGWPFSRIRILEKSERVKLIDQFDEMQDAARLLNSAAALRVGLLPLSGRFQTSFAATRVLDARKGIMGFKASGVSSQEGQGSVEEYLEELVKRSREAIDDGAMILVLPEYCVCGKGRERLREEIERDPRELALIVPGSFTQEDPRGPSNVAPLWIVAPSGKIKEIGHHEKEIPAEYEADRFRGVSTMEALVGAADAERCVRLREDLVCRDRRPNLVMLTPFGLISVAICSDLIPEESVVVSLFRNLDQLFVPSMNDGRTSTFHKTQERLSRDCMAGFFYVNSAQAVGHGVAMAIWSSPNGGRICAQSSPGGVFERKEAHESDKWAWVDYSEVEKVGGVIVASLPNPNRTVDRTGFRGAFGTE